MHGCTLPRRAVVILSVLLCATLLWAGDQPWNGKPYQTWDAKDVQQIMTRSPWVATTRILRSWTGPQKNTTVVQPEEPEISGGVRHAPRVMGNVAGNTGGTELPQVNVYVYWYSARVMRAASAREGVLQGKMDEPAVEKVVDTPPEQYQIVLKMDDMAPFIAKGAQFYEQNAFLEMQRSKLKLPPSKVQFERMGTTSEDVVFFFPKTANGAATIGSDETGIVFSCKIADQTMHADFKPKKMVDQFGADL